MVILVSIYLFELDRVAVVLDKVAVVLDMVVVDILVDEANVAADKLELADMMALMLSSLDIFRREKIDK